MKSKTLLLLPTFATGTFLRVAIFDNDGTLWTEQPMYVQPAFALDRIKALAPQHPEWNTNEPFCLRAQGDLKGIAASGENGAGGSRFLLLSIPTP